jgi:hypothetical protein
MSDLSLQWLDIKNSIAKKHKDYIYKHGQALAIVGGELDLSRTRILAKMTLLSKAFVQAGVIEDADEMVVSSRDGTYPMSVRLSRKNNPICLYLLNTGSDIVVSDSVGLALTSDTVESRILLVTDTKRVCKKFSNVLSEKFDWEFAANSILDAIHETIYDSHEVFLKELTGNFPSKTL